MVRSENGQFQCTQIGRTRIECYDLANGQSFHMERSVTPVDPKWGLDEIEDALRTRYLDSDSINSPFVIRLLSTSGEVGKRCLTFNIEVRESEFQAEKEKLDKMVNALRSFGWEIDELRQPVSTHDGWDARLWLMIYEEKTITLPPKEAVK